MANAETTTAVKPTDKLKASLIVRMASKYEIDATTFKDTVLQTVMPGKTTNEELAMFLIVANELELNPVAKEIYAFPKKGGGIQPIVSIDGWIKMVNRRPEYDGCEFDFHYDDAKKLVACSCRMYRKDRAHPVVVTEYLIECIRNTEPWRMQHRMLRHKAFIQAARLCFGFAGIIDEDEAEGFTEPEMRDVTNYAEREPVRSDFTVPAKSKAEDVPVDEEEKTVKADPETGEIEDPRPSFGHSDAYQLGVEARKVGKSIYSVPGSLSAEFQETWKEGWRDSDATLMKASTEQS